MNKDNSKHKKEITADNIIGSEQNRTMLAFQADLGIALRGGSLPMNVNVAGLRRLTSPVNLLSRRENIELIALRTVNSIYNN